MTEIVRPTATKPHLMLRPRLLPNTSTWKQLRSVEFGMAATLCTDVVTSNRFADTNTSTSLTSEQPSRQAIRKANVVSLIGAGLFSAFLPYVRKIGSLLKISQSHQTHWDGHSSGCCSILVPHCRGSMDHRSYPFIAFPNQRPRMVLIQPEISDWVVKCHELCVLHNCAGF